MAAGALNHYTVLYIVDAQVTETCMSGVAKWVHSGGKLIMTAGGGMLNESNLTNTNTMSLLPGLRFQGLYTGVRYDRWNSTIFWVKENLPWAERLDHGEHPTACELLF